MTATGPTDALKLIQQMNHDLLVAMQAAYIEWRHGGGAEAGMGWIANTLDGPGLIPAETEPYGKEAQAYFDANRAEPFPQCFCGRPSNQLWMGQGFCSEAHYRAARASDRYPEGAETMGLRGEAVERGPEGKRPEASGASQPQQPAPAEPEQATSFGGGSTPQAASLSAAVDRDGLTSRSAPTPAAAAVQPPVLPLTEEEIDSAWEASGDAWLEQPYAQPSRENLFARAIEAKVRGTGSVPPSANLDSVHPAQRSTQGARTEAGGSS